MLNRIAHRLMLTRLADYSANGLNEEKLVFKQEHLKNTAYQVWYLISKNSVYLSELQDLFEARFNNYRKNLGGKYWSDDKDQREKYMPPNAPGYDLAEKYLQDTNVADNVIDAFARGGKNGRHNNIPFNMFRKKNKELFEKMCRFFISPKDFSILSERQIRKKLKDAHPMDAKNYDEDEIIEEYDSDREDADYQEIVNQINLFKTLTDYVWSFCKEQLREHAMQLFYKGSKKYYTTDGSLGYGTPENDYAEYDQGLAAAKSNAAYKNNVTSAFSDFFSYYDKISTFDPKAEYTESEIDHLGSLTKDSAQLPALFNDMIARLRNSGQLQNFFETMLDELATYAPAVADKILSELDKSSMDELLTNKRSALYQNLKSVLSDKISEYKHKIKDMLKQYRKAKAEKAKEDSLLTDEEQQKARQEEESEADMSAAIKEMAEHDRQRTIDDINNASNYNDMSRLRQKNKAQLDEKDDYEYNRGFLYY